jgi:1-acyl-sn-glycerol-3-phosphate acyltransferase
VHGRTEQTGREPRVYIANHVSWFDILCMVDVLPHYGFVAKREIEKVPIFGPAAGIVGVIYIDRDNRKAAFGAYDDAAQRIRDGQSVIVYPEGTRGDDYALRPFKKGPFVLAIHSGAPIVPVVLYGTREVNRRGSLMVHPGTVHVHLLDPVPTEGLTYQDRDQLAYTVRERIASTLREQYGVTGHSVEAPRQNHRGAQQQQVHA